MADLRITPNGHALVEADDANAAIAKAFGESNAHGLLHLAGEALRLDLPPGMHFARYLARQYITALCHALVDPTQPLEPPPIEEMAMLAMQVPPIVGAEYVTGDLLTAWWRELDTLVRGQIAEQNVTVEAYVASLHPSWHTVGRVTFHLAENKRDPEHPFAFLATYTSGVSQQGKTQHVPLLRARQEYAGNRPALLKLLKPVHDAQRASKWVEELVTSEQIHRPLAWTPTEAHQFLKNIPILEAAGIVVKVPDWWKARQPARPQVSVTIGKKQSSQLGVDALLDFDVDITLDGKTLSQADIRALLESDQPLVNLRGNWIEVDKEKLQQALAQWNRVAKSAEDGISFIEGMRMLAGMPRAGGKEDEPEPTREWAGVQAGDWLRETLSKLRDPSAVSPPATLKATLRPYQEKGYAWLRFMSDLGLGACLADDMGLGKTVQVIALLLSRVGATPASRSTRSGESVGEVGSTFHVERDAGVASTKRPASLLVVPASLIPNWKAELARFAPSLKALVAHPSETDIRKKLALDEYDVVITTYTMLTRTESLREHAWDLAVLDEAQAIKNPSSRQTKASKQLIARARIAMSGTPVENRLSDLWSLFDFLNPGLLGSAKAFGDYAKRVNKPEGGEGYGALRKLIQPYILRRLKTDKRIISDLPDKIEVKTFCTLSKQQATLYQQSVEQLGRELQAASEGIQRRGLVLAYLMRFKQICNHPAQWSGDGQYDADASGKFERLTEICTELAQRQQRALVFTQFREMTEPLAHHLRTVFGAPGLVLHGSTSVNQRKEMVEQFQREDGPPFFVLSIKAGGTGLNLTAAANVIHFDRWWNPAVENQATDRAFRIGQKQNVLVQKFICRGTVEERIDALIEEKTGLSNELLGDAGAEKLLTEMSDSELMKFVALDLNRATAD